MMNKKLKEFKISRKRWFRAKPIVEFDAYHDDGSYLLEEGGTRKCCLGHLGTACGIRASALRGKMVPSEVSSTLWPKWLLVLDIYGTINDSELSTKLMAINDDRSTSDDQKEEKIIKIFKSKGIKVVFVD